MVAQISSETFNRTSLTPPMDSSDSDDLVLALETARALEAQGEIREAARWLRRAAEQAETDGNDARVLMLARAAADLTNTIAPASTPTPPPSSLPPSTAGSSIRLPAPKPAAWAHSAPPAPRTPTPQAPSRPPSAPAPVSARVSSPPPLPARVSSPPPLPARIPSQRPTTAATASPTTSKGARPAIPAGKPASPRVATDRPSHVVDKVITERTLRVTTMRVAIPASSRDASVFVVRRLKDGQSLPPGTTEATLVLNGESSPPPLD